MGFLPQDTNGASPQSIRRAHEDITLRLATQYVNARSFPARFNAQAFVSLMTPSGNSLSRPLTLSAFFGKLEPVRNCPPNRLPNQGRSASPRWLVFQGQ